MNESLWTLKKILFLSESICWLVLGGSWTSSVNLDKKTDAGIFPLAFSSQGLGGGIHTTDSPF